MTHDFLVFSVIYYYLKNTNANNISGAGLDTKVGEIYIRKT